MNPDEYRRGKYVWAEDEAEPTDTAPGDAAPEDNGDEQTLREE